jgi:hypothetical protein
LASFVDSPALASVDPTSHQTLVFFGHEIVEWASHYGCCREHAIIGAIIDVTMFREAVEDKESARGLGGKLRVTRGSVGTNVIDRKGLRRSERSDRLVD